MSLLTKSIGPSDAADAIVAVAAILFCFVLWSSRLAAFACGPLLPAKSEASAVLGDKVGERGDGHGCGRHSCGDFAGAETICQARDLSHAYGMRCTLLVKRSSKHTRRDYSNT